MPSLGPTDIKDILDAADALGVSRDIFNAPIEWRRSGNTRAAALHPAGDTCPDSGRTLRVENTETLTFSQLDGRKVCTCVLGAPGEVGNLYAISGYAQLLTCSAELHRVGSAQTSAPDWDAWITMFQLTWVYDSLTHYYDGWVYEAEGATYDADDLRLGLGVFAPAEDVAAVNKAALDAVLHHRAVSADWAQNRARADMWWADRLGDACGADEHAVLNLPLARVVRRGPGAADPVAEVVIAQYEVGRRRTTHHSHLLCAPADVLDHLGEAYPGWVDRFATRIDDEHLDLVFEMYEPDRDHTQLIAMARTAVPGTLNR